jgi:hypothetical protein
LTANVARRLVKHERGDFAEQAAEFLRLRTLVAQPREVVLHERMGDDGDALHLIFRRLPEKIHAAFAQFRNVQAEVELDVVRLAALAEHGRKSEMS